VSANSDSRRTGSDSARRLVEVLFAFTEESPLRTARELSEEVGIPIPSAHRYVALLRDLGLITDIRRGVYRLTPRIFLLSRAAQAANSILEIAEPHLRTLCAELNETVMLVQQLGDYPVCVARQESARAIRASFQPGHALPPLRGASAKVLLSGMSPDELDAYLARMSSDPEAEPPSSAWRAEMDTIRASGWGTSSHEVNEGVWAAAAAVRERNEVVAAVSVACPEFRTTEHSRAEVIERVQETARVISRELGVVPG
jgi:DNA-binding IclR family transcriptional regulator